MKTLLVIIDGAADKSCAALHGKTPLSAAHKPNLDVLASRGYCGRIRIAKNIAPESDVGIMAILGFNPFKQHVGRGALEALGLGLIDFKSKNYLALRCNFATIDKTGKIIDRRVSRSLTDKEGKALAREIESKVKISEVKIKFIHTISHRAVLVFYAQSATSKKIQNTDPAYQVTKTGVANALSKFKPFIAHSLALDDKKESEFSAWLVNEFTIQAINVLRKSKVNIERKNKGLLAANCILSRDAEVKLLVPAKRYCGWSVLADMPLELGIAKYTGMKIVKCSTANYKKAALLALKLLGRGSVYVHFKKPDLFGHDGNTVEKKLEIQRIDSGFFSKVVKRVDLKRIRIVVCSDHATPCEIKSHSNDLVPFIDSKRKLNKERYDEFNKEKPINSWELL